MVRCGCASDTCGCNFVAGNGVDISGVGSRSNPYVIEAVIPTAGGGGGSGRFSGEIVAYAGPVAPAGWLICDGSSVSRTVYSALFGVIGVQYGAGDGTTTFNIPNLVERFPMGAGGDSPRGTVGGSDEATLETENLPSHTHVMDHNHAAFSTAVGGAHDHPTAHSSGDGASGSTFREGATAGRTLDTSLVQTSTHGHTIDVPAFAGSTGATGSGTPVDIVPSNQAVNYLVKI